MNPKPIRDSPIWKPIRRVPIPIWGLLFWCFFQSRTRSAFSHQKLRQSGLRATASNLLSCRLLFSLHPPPSRLLVSSVIAPNPDDDDDDNDDDAVSSASTVDEHAKLKPILKTKQSSQSGATSPTCVSRVTWNESYKESHKGIIQKDRTKGSYKEIPQKDLTKTRSKGLSAGI